MASRPEVTFADAWERSKKAAKEVGNDLSEKAAIIPVGLSNIPGEIGKLSELSANSFSGWLNDRPQVYTDMDARTISNKYENPKFYSDDINNYRNYINETYPNSTKAAELAAGGLSKAGITTLAKVGKSAAKMFPKYLNPAVGQGKLPPIKTLLNRLNGNVNIGDALASGTAFSTLQDYGEDELSGEK